MHSWNHDLYQMVGGGGLLKWDNNNYAFICMFHINVNYLFKSIYSQHNKTTTTNVLATLKTKLINQFQLFKSAIV